MTSRRLGRGGAVLLLAFGCGFSEEPVRVGVALPSGWYRAIELGLEELEGVPLEVVRDSTVAAGQSLTGFRYAEWLADEGAVAVLGHDASRPSVEAASVYNEREILQVAPMVTSRALERQGPWSFSLAPSDSVEADFIAAYVDTMEGVSRAALLYHNDEFGIGLRDALVRAVEARGIEVVDERFFPPTTVPATRQDRVPTMVRAALLAEPDVLVLALREVDTKMVVAVLRERGVRIPLVASDASWVTAPPQGEPRFEGLEGLHLVRFWGEDWNPQAAAFAERFTARFGYPPDHGEALAYDALMLVASAVDFGARSAQEVRSYLLGLGTRAPAFEGVAGPYAFEDGRPRVVRLDVGMVLEGRVLGRGGEETLGDGH
jgi:branched-chain amino acid transport system substrate-binding protein